MIFDFLLRVPRSAFRAWKIRRLQKQSAALAAQIAEEKRLHHHSRKLAGLSIYQLRRIVRRQPNYRVAAESELARRLFRAETVSEGCKPSARS